MDLSKGHIKALQEGDLSSPKGIEACINASEALSQCMNVALKPGVALKLHPLCDNCTYCCPWAALTMFVWCSATGHDTLMAVKQQQHLFSELRDAFARRLTNHLNNVFVHQVTLLHMFQVKNTYRLHIWGVLGFLSFSYESFICLCLIDSFTCVPVWPPVVSLYITLLHCALCSSVSSTTSVTSKWPSLSSIGRPVCHSLWVRPLQHPVWPAHSNSHATPLL